MTGKVGNSYSREVARILDSRERLKISRQIRGLLKRELGDLSKLTCLDVGCSSGVITQALAKDFRRIVGIDADSEAIAIANRNKDKINLTYKVMDAEQLTFKDGSFDVVICNQVYQFVRHPKLMIKEIHRVLRNGGVCLMGARNKYAIVEAQTGLPLIHLVPILNKRMLKVQAKTYYPASYLSYYSLKKMLAKFEIINLTGLILKFPQNYGFSSLSKYRWLFKVIPWTIMEWLMPSIPNYIFLLRKSI